MNDEAGWELRTCSRKDYKRIWPREIITNSSVVVAQFGSRCRQYVCQSVCHYYVRRDETRTLGRNWRRRTSAINYKAAAAAAAAAALLQRQRTAFINWVLAPSKPAALSRRKQLRRHLAVVLPHNNTLSTAPNQLAYLLIAPRRMADDDWAKTCHVNRKQLNDHVIRGFVVVNEFDVRVSPNLLIENCRILPSTI